MRRNQQSLTVFETARAGLVKVKELMFFASALLQTKFIEDPSCPTAWTDMTVIGYNPAFIEGLDIPTAKFVIIHELMYILLKHGLRRGGRDPRHCRGQGHDGVLHGVAAGLPLVVRSPALYRPAREDHARVLVLEREQFPRDHVGESQTPPISFVLEEMECWQDVEEANFPIKIGATYLWGRSKELWDFDFMPKHLC